MPGPPPGSRPEPLPVAVPVLARLCATADAFAAAGAAPAEPRLAATVLLLRPASGGFQVYLMRRAPSLAFAAGMYAFPGGAVEPADATGPPPAGRTDRLGLPARPAAAVVRAAVRELSEETGVRLATADLVPWSRWITPEFEPRRYDTYFFVAAMPAGQQPRHRSGEADRAGWFRPAEALTAADAGTVLMLPPTAVTLAEVAGHATVPDVLAAAARRDPATAVRPRLVRDGDGVARLVGG